MEKLWETTERKEMQVEVKRVDPNTFVKVMLYMLVPVAGIMVFFGLLAVVGGAAFGAFSGTAAGIGVGLIALMGFIGIFLFEAVLIAVFSFIMALVYNLFAGKFGGLVMDLKSTRSEMQSLQERDGSERA